MFSFASQTRSHTRSTLCVDSIRAIGASWSALPPHDEGYEAAAAQQIRAARGRGPR